MKNKFGITAAAILVALSLSACSNSNSQSSSSSSSKASSSQVQKKQTKQSASSSSKANSSSSSKPSSQAPKESRVNSLSAELRKEFPDMLLPTKDGLGQGSDKLNVRYTKKGNTNTIYYSVGNSAKNFNDASLKNEKPYAVLTEVQSVSSSKAEDMINFIPAQKGLSTKKLDSKTKATVQGAAGTSYLQWNDDGYSVVVRKNNKIKSSQVKFAKKVLALINKYGLPEKSGNASVQVTMGDSLGSLHTVITWKHGKDLYQIKAHDTQTALIMLASLK